MSLQHVDLLGLLLDQLAQSLIGGCIYRVLRESDINSLIWLVRESHRVNLPALQLFVVKTPRRSLAAVSGRFLHIVNGPKHGVEVNIGCALRQAGGVEPLILLLLVSALAFLFSQHHVALLDLMG